MSGNPNSFALGVLDSMYRGKIELMEEFKDRLDPADYERHVSYYDRVINACVAGCRIQDDAQ